jgi:hypothetical protein
MSIRRRPSRKDGKGFATRAAETAPYPDPVVVFIMGLLAPLAVADNGVASAVRAATRQQRQREGVQRECGLVLRTRQCDKENQGWCEGLPLTVSCQVPIRGGPSPSRHIRFKRKKNTAF